MLVIFPLPTYAFAASALSQYEQFGSITAHAETCLQSANIPQRNNSALQRSGLHQETINTLIKPYDDALDRGVS
jgi:hypothetical protein